jgi:hypothetical protein
VCVCVCGGGGVLFTKVTDTCEGVWYADRNSVHHATVADRLMRARDSKCAEPSKTRSPLSVMVTCIGGWRAETLRVQQTTEADCLTGGQVTLNAQNRPKLGRLRLCRSF